MFLLVGMAALFAGFDQNVYGFAIPQIQASLHIPENQIGLTVTYFRVATFVAMMLALTADIVGRRRLLLITIFGQAAFTLATAFSQTYAQFVWLQVLTRVFGYAEEMLCIVVIVEEVAANVRGWAAGTLAGLTYTGAGFAALCFAAVNILPGHWRALYVIGGFSMFFLAFLRRRLPETKRFRDPPRGSSEASRAHRRRVRHGAAHGARISRPHSSDRTCRRRMGFRHRPSVRFWRPAICKRRGLRAMAGDRR